MTTERPSPFFTVRRTADGEEWLSPTASCRGPWDPGACHAGPPTAMLARAMERAVPDASLVRLTVDLVRPVPMAGFRVRAEVTRAGRTVSTTTAVLLDGDDRPCAQATGLHLRTVPVGEVPSPGTPGAVADPTGAWPRLDGAIPGPFPIRASEVGIRADGGFTGAVEVRYPDGEDPEPGPTTLWLRTAPLLGDEEASPFQRICALADCGNGISRNAEPSAVRFVNADLTVALHRAPVGDWFASRAISRWEPTGIGLSDATLFDVHGPVGRALQTLVLSRNG